MLIATAHAPTVCVLQGALFPRKRSDSIERRMSYVTHTLYSISYTFIHFTFALFLSNILYMYVVGCAMEKAPFLLMHSTNTILPTGFLARAKNAEF